LAVKYYMFGIFSRNPEPGVWQAPGRDHARD